MLEVSLEVSLEPKGRSRLEPLRVRDGGDVVYHRSGSDCEAAKMREEIPAAPRIEPGRLDVHENVDFRHVGGQIEGVGETSSSFAGQSTGDTGGKCSTRDQTALHRKPFSRGESSELPGFVGQRTERLDVRGPAEKLQGDPMDTVELLGRKGVGHLGADEWLP